MTRYEKICFMKVTQLMTDKELKERYDMLTEAVMGSVAEEMSERDYPPEMIRERYENEKDTEWCLHYVETQLKERGLLDEEIKSN